MKNDRLRVPVDEAYVAAIGRATYVFSTLEWNAVWCCERMRKNYISMLGRKTAGAVAQDLVKFSHKRPLADRAACVAPAVEFARLVKQRNALLHGKPGTAAGGAQRLFHEGAAWDTASIDDLADEFAACSIVLNALLYGELK